MNAPALYVGSVMHRRLSPRRHRFRYRAFWLLFDVDQIDAVCASVRLLSRNRFNVFSLYDRDHGDASRRSLRTLAEQDLLDAGIAIGQGKIRLLCMPRTAGYSFNPLSVYFCFYPDGAPAALIYEVHNTFGERHRYVMAWRGQHQDCEKSFYVSPFLQDHLRYKFSIAARGARLAIAIRAEQDRKLVFVASLVGSAETLSDMNLIRCFALVPFVTIKVILAIHWEALRLWLKRVPLTPRSANPGAEL